nr:hypothetical protein GCM10020093_003560 [Planobispora longispora]
MTPSPAPDTPPTARVGRAPLLAAVVVPVVTALICMGADRMLGQVPALLPAFLAVVCVSDLLTAFLLITQFLAGGDRRLLALSCAYLWSAAVIVSHALVFSGLFSPPGCSARRLEAGAGNIPVIMANGSYRVLTERFGAAIIALNVVALLLAATRFRGAVRGLEAWAMVAVIASCGDVILTLFAGARFTFGWYGARLPALVAALVVLTSLLREITTLYRRVRRHADELSLHNEELRRANALRDHLVAVVSHELRSPLAAVRGFLEIVDDHPDLPPERARQMIARSQVLITRLTMLTEDLLTTPGLDAGQLSMSPVPVDLREALTECAVLFPEASITVDCPDGPHARSRPDPGAPPACGGGAPDRGSRSSELAGLVVTGGLPGDDVHAVEGVDEGDPGHQGGELLLVVVLGGVRPGLVGDPAGRVRDPGALLGQLQRGALGLGEDRGLPPGRDQAEAHRRLTGGEGVLGVHVGAETAPVDLARAELHQLLRRGRQRRFRQRLVRGDEVLQELACGRAGEEVQAGIHGGLLCRGRWSHTYDGTAPRNVTRVNVTCVSFPAPPARAVGGRPGPRRGPRRGAAVHGAVAVRVPPDGDGGVLDRVVHEVGVGAAAGQPYPEPGACRRCRIFSASTRSAATASRRSASPLSGVIGVVPGVWRGIGTRSDLSRDRARPVPPAAGNVGGED